LDSVSLVFRKKIETQFLRSKKTGSSHRPTSDVPRKLRLN